MSFETGFGIELENLELYLDIFQIEKLDIGRSIWEDISLKNNDAQIIGNVSFNNNGSLDFPNNPTERLQIDDIGPDNSFAFGTGDFSIELWIYPTSFSNDIELFTIGNDTIFSLKSAASTGEIFFTGLGFSTQGNIAGWNLTLNEWNSVIFQRNGTTAECYLNGVLIGTQGSFSIDVPGEELVFIRNGANGNFAELNLRVVKVYSQTLDQEYILNYYENTENRQFVAPIIDQTLSANVALPAILTQINTILDNLIPITATGGFGNTTFSISPALPEGYEFDITSGEISGSTILVGSSTHTITVTDSLGNTDSASFDLTVENETINLNVRFPTVEIQTNQDFRIQPVVASGGVGTLTYSISPALPSGVTDESRSWDVSVVGATEYQFSGYSSGINPTLTAPVGSFLEFNVTQAAEEIVGQQAFITPGTFSYTVPQSVTQISAVAVAGGGGGGGNNGSSGPGSAGGGGGGLSWIEILEVTPGETLEITVGAGGAAGTTSANAGDGGASSITRASDSTVLLEATGGGGGQSNVTSGGFGDGGLGGSFVDGAYGGGNGGIGGAAQNNGAGAGGGGAGGYSGNGGKGDGTNGAEQNGSGGGGAGGQAINSQPPTANAGGGGVGILGQGSNGTIGSPSTVGGSGAPESPTSSRAGLYGGGGGATEDDTSAPGQEGGHGAVRIIFGEGRAYPATNTEDVGDSGGKPIVDNPFWLKTELVTGTGSAINIGVTNNGAAEGTVTWNTSGFSPGIYYYVSEVEAGMSGIIQLVDAGGIDFDTTTGEIFGLPRSPTQEQVHTITVTDQSNPVQSESADINFKITAGPLIVTSLESEVFLPLDEPAEFRPASASGGVGTLTYSTDPELPSNSTAGETLTYEVTADSTDYIFAGGVEGSNPEINVEVGTILEFNVEVGEFLAGQDEFTSPGSYSFTVPTGITSISAVVIGGGAGGMYAPLNGSGSSGAGGGLAYANNIPVTPGETLSVTVGSGGIAGIQPSSTLPTNGGRSELSRGGDDLLFANGGEVIASTSRTTSRPAGGTAGGSATGVAAFTGGQGAASETTQAGLQGGGNGAQGGAAGSGGGNGGGGAAGYGVPGAPVASGGISQSSRNGGGGGGTRIFGSGIAGQDGEDRQSTRGGNGGQFGGGGGSGDDRDNGGAGASGAVRIIYGAGREFPNTETEDVPGTTRAEQPFWVKTAQTTGTGDAAPGVENNGATSGTVVWDTIGLAEGTYYYISENDSGFSGVINLTSGPTEPSLTIDSGTGVITGTPTRVLEPETFNIIVTDQDTPTPNSASQSFTLGLGTGSSALFEFETFTFTPGNATNEQGPSLADVLSLYDSTANPWLNNSEFFTVQNGIQQWTVPADGDYEIEARGAEGGQGTAGQGGQGATIKATIPLVAEEKINIIVGQNPDASGEGGGGGGGSFVWKELNAQPLVIAGGGGGGADTFSSDEDGVDAQSGTSGTGSRTTVSNGGSDGEGGGGATAGGGGGFVTDGGNGSRGAGGQAALNGGVGGNSGVNSGGFGGGGGENSTGDNEGGGGAGGYSGGGGGNGGDDDGGGGGGSFITADALEAFTFDGNFNTSGTEPHLPFVGSVTAGGSLNQGDGLVTITLPGGTGSAGAGGGGGGGGTTPATPIWTPDIISSTGTSGTRDYTPVNIWYRRSVVVATYSAAELQAAFGSTNAQIEGMRFQVVGAPANQPLPNYAIGMKNTFEAIDNNNSGSTGGSFTEVKAPSNETFSDNTVKEFTFTTPYAWTGGNLAIVWAWGQVQPSFDASGTIPVGSGTTFFSRTDSSGTYTITDNATGTQSGRPVIQLNGIPQ